MKKLVATFILFYLSVQSTDLIAQLAEAPPSLSAGISGLSYSKGNIDIELLSEIITKKQEELKTEFLKRAVTKHFKDNSFTLYNYTYSSMDALLEFEDKKAIQKVLLENTANLSLVYGFSEFYLGMALQKNLKVDSIVKLLSFGDDRLKKKLDALSAENGLIKLKKYSALKLAYPLGDTESKTTTTKKTIDGKKTKTLTTSITYNDSISYSELFIDMVYDIMKNNPTLQEKGFFSIHKDLRAAYDQNNKYLLYKKHILNDKEAGIYKRVEELIGIITDYYKVFEDYSEGELTLNDMLKGIQAQFDPLLFNGSGINSDQLSNRIEQIKNHFYTTIGDIKEVEQEFSSDQSKKLGISSIAHAINELSVRQQSGKESIFTVNDLYYIKEQVYPLISSLIVEEGVDPILVEDLRFIENLIRLELTKNCYDRLKAFKPQLEKVPLAKYYSYIQLISNLDKLDIATSYEAMLKAIADVADILEDQNAKKLLNEIVSNANTFTSVDKEKNQIDINVEEIILRLYEDLDARFASKPINFYFSIGLNQANVIDKAVDIGGNSISSLSFASEKIGLKWKVYDIKKRRNYEIGDKPFLGKKVEELKSKDPFVSNVHFVGYGSGLLYNIANTTTSDNLSGAMVGTGVGLSFFNATDFNLFANWLWLPNQKIDEAIAIDKAFIGFSWDIKISEYLKQLRLKRNKK